MNCKRTTIEGYAQDCTWRPTSNYKTISRTADEAKFYCENYSGCQNDRNHMMYLRYAVAGVPSASYTESPSAPLAELFAEGSAYRIRNVNSGLYLQVAGVAAKNGTNVQQWGSDGIAVHDIWKLCSAGEGYYYLVSAVGDGGTYVLDVAGKKAANGTNIDIYTYNGGDNQKFMLTKNGDGSYQIRTHISNGNSVVEVENASQTSGANVQQWEVNGANCQNWILEPTTDPGCSMNTDVIYTFENAGSGLVMDITDGKMTDNTNVQQWSSNGLNCQKWTLRAFGSGNYYWIRSQQDSHYALKAEGSKNGGNLAIAAWSNKDSTQLFRFTKNLDGSYSILTHASGDSCYVEVADASTASGANVQQWEPTGSSCQKWQTKTETTTVTTTTTTKATTNTTTAAATSTTTATSTEPPVISGDINADGKTNLADWCCCKVAAGRSRDQTCRLAGRRSVY
ncbi:MAG: RICIN domain-containing protein [Ruminococcus callidus]